MQGLPHHYPVTAATTTEGYVDLTSAGLDVIQAAPPAEFGSPGDRWSPETLSVAAVACCFLLTLKAIARPSKWPWVSLRCAVAGVLDRIYNTSHFMVFSLPAVLDALRRTDQQEAWYLLGKAEHGCLIA